MRSAPPVSSRMVVFALLGVFPAMALVYIGITRPLERIASAAWHRHATLARVEDASVLMRRFGYGTKTPRTLGAYQPTLPWGRRSFHALAESLRTPLAVASWYQAWGDGPDHEFKSDAMSSLTEAGLTPLVTWEPWVGAFQSHLGQNPSASLDLIAQGSFDPYIRAWARAAAIHGKAFFLRPFHEVGNPLYPWGPAHGNTPASFRAAWRHVRDIFRQEGARNAAFVWTPYLATDTAFWPGDTEVDWIGIDIFNYGGLAENGAWIEFETILRTQRRFLSHLGKPMLVAEVASSNVGGDKTDWTRKMFRWIRSQTWPEFRVVVLFDHRAGEAPNGLPLDWSLGTTPGLFDSLRSDAKAPLSRTTP